MLDMLASHGVGCVHTTRRGGEDFVIRWGAEMGTVTRTSEQKQCPHVSTTGAS